jgi:hypothetical protein
MTNTENPEHVAVVGLGLLGRGIAACFLGPDLLRDIKEHGL